MYRKILDYIIIILIIMVSAFITYNILIKSILLVENNLIIIEKEVMYSPTIYIWWEKYIEDEINISIINEKKDKIEDLSSIEETFVKEDFYKMNYKDLSYLLSNDKDSYTYWFISKQIKDNILYLYSHNSYKFTENSGYFLYNNLKLYDEITFNDWQFKYRIIKSDLIDLDKEEIETIKLQNNVDIVYFTCTPHWWNIRKVYQLEKINN